MHEVIDEGSFGTVFHATHASDSSHYAVKLIPITKYPINNKLNQYTDNESKMLSRIGPSIHIINFFELIKPDNYYYLVYEYCEGGTLIDLIRREGRLEERKAMKYLDNCWRHLKCSISISIILRIRTDTGKCFFQMGTSSWGIWGFGDLGICKKLGLIENLTKTIIG